MFGWYRPSVQLMKWGAHGTAWLRSYRWELRGYREFMDFVHACLPEGASLDRDGQVVGADGNLVPHGSARTLFRNLDQVKVTPRDCKRFASLARSCELWLPAERWAESATSASVYTIFQDFRHQSPAVAEVVEAWPLFGSSPLYVALTKAYAAGVPGEYLRALSYTFDEEEWYLAQRLVSYSPAVYQAGVPADFLLDFFVSSREFYSQVPPQTIIRAWETGLTADYLRAGKGARLSDALTVEAWMNGVPVEYLGGLLSQ